MTRAAVPPAARAFTLVEMLAAVAVIGILAALLLPALNRARQQSQWAGCTANLGQVGAAMLLFAGENNNYFPACWSGSTGGNLGAWSKVLLDRGYLSGPSALSCPADRFRKQEARPRSYSYPSPGMCPNYQTGAMQNRLQIPQPAKTYMLIEWHSRSQDYASPNAGAAGWSGTVTSHPNGDYNMLFIDGHIERRTSAQAFTSTSGYIPTQISP